MNNEYISLLKTEEELSGSGGTMTTTGGGQKASGVLPSGEHIADKQ